MPFSLDNNNIMKIIIYFYVLNGHKLEFFGHRNRLRLLKEYAGDENFDKVLLAIAKLVKNVVASKLMIDKVIRELGMAKSSLYMLFANKN